MTETQTLTMLVAGLLPSPDDGGKAIAKQRAAVGSVRAALLKRREDRGLALAKQIDDLEQTIKNDRVLFAAAEQEKLQHLGRLHEEAWRLDRAVSTAEGQLRKTSSPLIDKVLDAIFIEVEWTRQNRKIDESVEASEYVGMKKHTWRSNQEAWERRTRALVEARESLELIRLEVFPDDVCLCRALKKIVEAIPERESLDVMSDPIVTHR